MVLFALLHFASYSLALLDTLGNCQQMSTNFKLISWAWPMSPLLHLYWNSHFCHLQWDTFLFRIFPHFCFQHEMDFAGQNSWWGARMLISLVEFQSRNILRYCFQKLRKQSNCVTKSVKLYYYYYSSQNGGIQWDLPDALQHHDDLHRLNHSVTLVLRLGDDYSQQPLY